MSGSMTREAFALAADALEAERAGLCPRCCEVECDEGCPVGTYRARLAGTGNPVLAVEVEVARVERDGLYGWRVVLAEPETGTVTMSSMPYDVEVSFRASKPPLPGQRMRVEIDHAS